MGRRSTWQFFAETPTRTKLKLGKQRGESFEQLNPQRHRFIKSQRCIFFYFLYYYLQR